MTTILQSGPVGKSGALVTLEIQSDIAASREPVTIKLDDAVLAVPDVPPVSVGTVEGCCYLQGPSSPYTVLSGGVTLQVRDFNALEIVLPKLASFTPNSLHVGSDGLQIKGEFGDAGDARLRWAPSLGSDGTPAPDHAVWHELTTTIGKKIHVDVVRILGSFNTNAPLGISLIAQDDPVTSFAGLRATFLGSKSTNQSATAFTPPFSLKVLDAEWRPGTCWRWSDNDNDYLEFTDLPFDDRVTHAPWNPLPQASGVTITSDGARPTLTLADERSLVATGRVTDGINDLPVAWQYTDVRIQDRDDSFNPGVWVQWRIPKREAPARVAVEAASLASGLQGLFSFVPKGGDGWTCEVGLKPQPGEAFAPQVNPRIRLRLTKPKGQDPTWSATLLIEEPQVFASSPELRFLGLATTDPESLPHAPALDAALIDARVEFALPVASEAADPVNTPAVTLAPATFTIAASDHVRVWLPLPWAGLDDGDLTGANQPTTTASAEGRPDAISRDRNQGLVPHACGQFTLAEGSPSALPGIILGMPPSLSVDPRANREVIAALLPWVAMQYRETKPETEPPQFAPYHRNLVLEHFEDREAMLPAATGAAAPRPATTGRSRRVRDRHAQAADWAKQGTESPLLNWLPTKEQNSRGKLKIDRPSECTRLPTLEWQCAETTQALVIPTEPDSRAPSFLTAKVAWDGSNDPQIIRTDSPTDLSPFTSAGHVPPVFSNDKYLDSLAVSRSCKTVISSPAGRQCLNVRTIKWIGNDYREITTIARTKESEKLFIVADDFADSAKGHSIAILAADLLLCPKVVGGNIWGPLPPGGKNPPPIPLGSFGVCSVPAVPPSQSGTQPPMDVIDAWPRIAGWPFLATGVAFTLQDDSFVTTIDIEALLLNPVDLVDLTRDTLPDFARRALAATEARITITFQTPDNGATWQLLHAKGDFDWSFPLADQMPPVEAPRSIPGRIERLVGTITMAGDTLEFDVKSEGKSRIHALGASWPLKQSITLVASECKRSLTLRERLAPEGTLDCRRVLPHVLGPPARPLAKGLGKDGEAVVITGATADDLFVSDVDSGEAQIRCRDRYRDGLLIKNGRAESEDCKPYEAVLVHVDGSLHVVPAMDSTKDADNAWMFVPPDEKRPAGWRRFELDSPIESAIAFDGSYQASQESPSPHRLYLCRCADGSARLVDDQAGEVLRFDLPGTTITAMAFGPNISTSHIKVSAKQHSKLRETAFPLTYAALGGADGSIRIYEIPSEIASPSHSATSHLAVRWHYFTLSGAVTSISLIDDGATGTPANTLLLFACTRSGETPLFIDLFSEATAWSNSFPKPKGSTITSACLSSKGNIRYAVWLTQGQLQAARLEGGNGKTFGMVPATSLRSAAYVLARHEQGSAFLIYVERSQGAQPSLHVIDHQMDDPVSCHQQVDTCLSLDAVANEDGRLLILAIEASGAARLFAANNKNQLGGWEQQKRIEFHVSSTDTPLATFADTVADVVTRIVAGRVEVWDVAMDRLRWQSPEACGLFGDGDIGRVRFAFIRQCPSLVIGRHNDVEVWNLATGIVEQRFATEGEVTHLDVAIDERGEAHVLLGLRVPGNPPAIRIYTLTNATSKLLASDGVTGPLTWLRFHRSESGWNAVAIGGAAGALWTKALQAENNARPTCPIAAVPSETITAVVVEKARISLLTEKGKLFRGDISGNGCTLTLFDASTYAIGSTALAEEKTCVCVTKPSVGPLQLVTWSKPDTPVPGLKIDGEVAALPDILFPGWQSLELGGKPSKAAPFALSGVGETEEKGEWGWASNIVKYDLAPCGVRTRKLPGAPFRVDHVNWPSIVSAVASEGGALVRVWDRHSGVLRYRFEVADLDSRASGSMTATGGARPWVEIKGQIGGRAAACRCDWAVGQVTQPPPAVAAAADAAPAAAAADAAGLGPAVVEAAAQPLATPMPTITATGVSNKVTLTARWRDQRETTWTIDDHADPLVIEDALGVRVVATHKVSGAPVVLWPTPWLRISSDPASPPQADLPFTMKTNSLIGRVTPARQCEVVITEKALPGIAAPLIARPSLVQSDANAFAIAPASPSSSKSEPSPIESGVLVISGVQPKDPPAFQAVAIYERLIRADDTVSGTIKVGSTPIKGCAQARLFVTAQSSTSADTLFDIRSVTVTGIIKAKAEVGSEPAWQMHLAEQPGTRQSAADPPAAWGFLAQRPAKPSPEFAWQGFVPVTCAVDLEKPSLEISLTGTPFLGVPLGQGTAAARPRGLPTVRDDVVLPQAPDLGAVVSLDDQVVDLADGQLSDPSVTATPAAWYTIAASADSTGFALQALAADAIPLDPLGGIAAIEALPKLGLDTPQLVHRRDHGGRLRAAAPTGMAGMAGMVVGNGALEEKPPLLLLPAIEVKEGQEEIPRARVMAETLVLGALPLPTRDRGLRSEMSTESILWVTPQTVDVGAGVQSLISATAVASTRGQLPEAIFTDRTIRALAVDAGASGLLVKRTLDAAGCVSMRFVNSPYHAVEPQTLEESAHV